MEYLTWLIEDPTEVSDTELRVIVRLLLQHLKLDAVRGHDGHGNGPQITLKPE